jgi:MOSC domain-containing protein YiiM
MDSLTLPFPDATIRVAGRIAALHRSGGGVPKSPVDHAAVTANGLEGDGHRYQGHGGPDRALCLYSLEIIEQLELEGHPIFPGSTGENVTIERVDWRDVIPGVRMNLGAVAVEITSYAAPCKTIRPYFTDGDSTRISQKLYPGWSRVYARVLKEGTLRIGDTVEITD